MVSQSGDGILRRGAAVRVGRRTDSGITHRRCIKREERMLAELNVIERRQLHKEIMRVLSVCDGAPKSGLTLLKKLRIKAMGDGGRLQTDHGAQGKLSGPQLMLRHAHDPVGGEYLVGAAWPALLDGVQECHPMQHERPDRKSVV